MAIKVLSPVFALDINLMADKFPYLYSYLTMISHLYPSLYVDLQKFPYSHEVHLFLRLKIKHIYTYYVPLFQIIDYGSLHFIHPSKSYVRIFDISNFDTIKERKIKQTIWQSNSVDFDSQQMIDLLKEYIHKNIPLLEQFAAT